MEPDLSMALQAAMAAESDRYLEIYDNQTARQKTLHHFITIYNKQSVSYTHLTLPTTSRV